MPDADKINAYLQKNSVNHTLTDIDAQPTVDAEPVRHGHWIKRSKVYPGLPYDHTYHYECSNCRCMDTAGEDVEVPYCWHCGAKMDGRKEDELLVTDKD